MKVFLLQLRHFAHVMTFAGSEDEDETGEGRERRNRKTKHAPKE
jgi:hypothetical protein